MASHVGRLPAARLPLARVCATVTAGLTLVAAGASAAAASGHRLPRNVHSIGTITLLDAKNRAVTGGRTDVAFNSEVTHAVGSGPGVPGYLDGCQLSMWTPSETKDPSQWDGGPLGIPNALTADQKKSNLEATNVSDWSLERDVVLSAGPSKGAYANLYELRLLSILNGPEDAGQYYTLGIRIDPATHTWKVIAPDRAGGSALPWVLGGIGVLLAVAGAVVVGLRRRAAKGDAERASREQPQPAVPA